jgi:hypothetical protein
MPATAGQILAGGNYDTFYHLQQVGKVKVYRSQVADISGVNCTIYQNPDDPDCRIKMTGIEDGIKRVVDCGYDFPGGITFYTSSGPGFQSAAFHRTHGGGRKVTVLLGDSCINTAGMVGKQGIADQVAIGSPVKYCAAVVVHELGHNLHEVANEGFFWDADGGTLPPNELASQVSQYAASSKKELVAEVFTGMAYGMIYKPAIMQLYADYFGPVPSALIGGGRRRR